VVSGGRCADFTIDGAEAIELVERAQPVLTFVCSPNNPTGRAESLELIAKLLAATEGLVVVDEAYGQFAPHSALELREQTEGLGRLVVVRTFSKTWSMAAARLGYLVADPRWWPPACSRPAYHLSAVTQEAGRLALTFVDEMEARLRSSLKSAAGSSVRSPSWRSRSGPRTPTSCCSGRHRTTPEKCGSPWWSARC